MRILYSCNEFVQQAFRAIKIWMQINSITFCSAALPPCTEIVYGPNCECHPHTKKLMQDRNCNGIANFIAAKGIISVAHRPFRISVISKVGGELSLSHWGFIWTTQIWVRYVFIVRTGSISLQFSSAECRQEFLHQYPFYIRLSYWLPAGWKCRTQRGAMCI